MAGSSTSAYSFGSGDADVQRGTGEGAEMGSSGPVITRQLDFGIPSLVEIIVPACEQASENGGLLAGFTNQANSEPN